jgi:hypothetical protein
MNDEGFGRKRWVFLIEILSQHTEENHVTIAGIKRNGKGVPMLN